MKTGIFLDKMLPRTEKTRPLRFSKGQICRLECEMRSASILESHAKAARKVPA